MKQNTPECKDTVQLEEWYNHSHGRVGDKGVEINLDASCEVGCILL